MSNHHSWQLMPVLAGKDARSSSDSISVVFIEAFWNGWQHWPLWSMEACAALLRKGGRTQRGWQAVPHWCDTVPCAQWAQPLTATGSDHVWAPAGAAPNGNQEFSCFMCGALPLLSEGQVLGLDPGKYFLSKEEYRTEASLTIHSLQSGWRHKRFWGSQL